MKLRFVLFMLSFLVAFTSWGKPNTQTTKKPVKSKKVRTVKKPAPQKIKKAPEPAPKPVAEEEDQTPKLKTAASRPPMTAKRWEFRGGLVIWQEPIKGELGSAKGQMESQSRGVILGLDRMKLFSHSAWSWFWGTEFGIGVVKGEISLGSEPDRLTNHSWYLLGGNLGFLHRTSRNTAYGMSVPLYARYIAWQIDKDSDLELQKETSFTVGTSLFSDLRLSQSAFLRLHATHNYLWSATIWGVSFQYQL